MSKFFHEIDEVKRHIRMADIKLSMKEVPGSGKDQDDQSATGNDSAEVEQEQQQQS